MVEIREQVKHLLEGIVTEVPYSVKMRFPKSVSEGNLITYYEAFNTQTSVSVVDDIAFYIDIWAHSMSELVELVHEADLAITSKGWRRQFSSPDYQPPENGGYFRKTLRYGGRVDTRTNRIII